MTFTKLVLLAAGASAVLLSAGPALSQTFPSKPVTIIVGFPPAGPLDWMARVVAPKLQERWGQPVIVDNRPGAGGLLAVQAVQKAAPDGHILTPHTQQVALIPLFVKQAEIDPGRNLQPLGTVFTTPYIVMTNSQTPAKSLREFIAYAKANPGKMNNTVASQTGQHLDSIAFVKALGIDLAHISYKGGAATNAAVLSNEAQLTLTASAGLVDGQIKAGKLVALAVTSPARFSLFPDVPTVKEAAGVDFRATVDFGYFTTQGTPRTVVDKLTRDIAQAMDTPEIREQIRKQGYEPQNLSADAWLAQTNAELRRAKEIAAGAGITPQ
jgi:tripartite-type tricarboxylate transporter receptor subunit TctC